jgi:hypothetical protein
MASIHEKPPHFVIEKTWDEKTLPPKTYKFQSNDPYNKVKAKIHQDIGKLGIKFTINKTISEFEMGVKNIYLNWAHSFMDFKNVLQGQYKTAWKQVLNKNFPGPNNPAMVPAARSLMHGGLPSCSGAFCQKASSQGKTPELPVHLYDARQQLRHQEKLVTSPIEHLD